MRTIVTIFVLFWVSFGIVESGFAFRYGTAKVTFKVLDEQNRPIEGATISGGFAEQDKGVNARRGFSSITDAEGEFFVSGRTHGEIGYSAEKKGYYKTSGRYRKWFREQLELKSGKWQPWNPTVEIVLKKIENPIPMYAKKASVVIPEFDKPFGFDLEKSDLVSPYGTGATSDFVFTVNRQGSTWEDFELSIQLGFSNDGDGIQTVKVAPFFQGSRLRLPKIAPTNGYSATWTQKIGQTPEKGRFNLKVDDTVAYIFRVRSQLDTNGNVIYALYGKIDNGISVTGYTAKQIAIHFGYYLNPDNTRNLEFDTKQNLFKNLKPSEQVSNP